MDAARPPQGRAAAAALALATRRAYRAHLRAWEAWCRARGACPAPAAPALVANHLADLAGTHAHSTLTGRLAAIVRAHRLLGVPFDAADPGLRETLAGIARTHGTRPKRQAVPLASVTTCPLRGRSACSGIAQGPLFRGITRHGTLRPAPLSAEAVRLILQERAWEAGYRGADLARLTPHSLRAGCITALAQASVHERDIMQHSRHASQTVMRGYIRAAATDPPVSAALWRRKDG